MAGYIQLLGSFGGSGGGPWDDKDFLREQDRNMGYGGNGVMLKSLEVHRWCHPILSETRVTYVSMKDPGCVFTGPERAAIKSPEATINFQPYEERVTEVEIAYGAGEWHAGATCLNRVRFTMQNIATGDIRMQSVGMSSATPHTCIITIPEGFTLAGFCGRSGDSWDQLGLYLCPWVPRAWTRENHSLCPEPFQEQVAALKEAVASYRLPNEVEEALAAALFKETFFEGVAGAAAEDDYIRSWCRQKVEAAAAEVVTGTQRNGAGSVYDLLSSDEDEDEEW